MKFDSLTEMINSARKMDPELFGKDLRGRLLALSYSSTFAPKPRKAQIELLSSAITACDLVRSIPEAALAEIAPSVPGLPIVLPGTKERAREWKKAKRLITKLQAGAKHPSRFKLESIGDFAGFVDCFISLAIAERDNWKINTPHFGRVTAEDVKRLPKLAENILAATYGEEWQDHPNVLRVFANHICRADGERKVWKECSRWQKRQFVRDKFKGAAQTYAAQLERFRKI